MSVILVGAGGHAKALVEAMTVHGHKVGAYVDATESTWLLGVRRIAADHELDGVAIEFVLGFGGVTPDQLRRRLQVYKDYQGRGMRSPAIIHPAANVSRQATIGSGAVVLAGAVVQPGAQIGEAAIVNSGAIVEHDSRVGAGTHVAPGAVLLGDVTVGDCAMVGANAVVLPGAQLPSGGFVRALERYPN